MPGKLKEQRAERLAKKHKSGEKVIAKLFTLSEDIQDAAEYIASDLQRTHLLNISKSIHSLADARETEEALDRG